MSRNIAISSYLATLIDDFEKYPEEKIVEIAKTSIVEFIQTSGMNNDQLAFKAMIIGAKAGMSIDSEEMNEKEKQLVTDVFGDYYNGDMEAIYEIFNKKMPESELEFIRMVGGTPIGMSLLKYILAFAYIDGEMDSVTAKMLDEAFAVSLMTTSYE